MNQIVAKRAAFKVPPAVVAAANVAVARYVHVDPLEEDRPDDEIVTTTRRAISRIALVATEVATRFQREAVPFDPMTWMLAPRSLFGGSRAIDACLDRDACLRGVLIHGLSLGLDADPAAIDALSEDADEYNNVVTCDSIAVDLGFDDRGANKLPFVRSGGERLRLFTATVVANKDGEMVQAFHASLATEEAEVAGRLYCRMGAASADAVIVDGFDPTVPLVAALVSDAICDTLAIVASDPASPIAAGLDLNIEQRFYS